MFITTGEALLGQSCVTSSPPPMEGVKGERQGGDPAVPDRPIADEHGLRNHGDEQHREVVPYGQEDHEPEDESRLEGEVERRVAWQG